MQTLQYCKAYFKKNVIESKSGFFLKALQENYFKDIADKETVYKSKVATAQQQAAEDAAAKEKEALDRKEKITELRASYLTNDFVEAVLEEHSHNFLHAMMERSRRAKKPNKYLDAYIDKKLLELYGEESI